MRNLILGLSLLTLVGAFSACDIFVRSRPSTVIVEDQQPDVVVVEDQTPDNPPPVDVDINIEDNSKGESGGETPPPDPGK